MHGHEIGVRAGGMVTANQMRAKTNTRSGPFSDRTITIGRRRRTSSSALARYAQGVPVFVEKGDWLGRSMLRKRISLKGLYRKRRIQTVYMTDSSV